MKTLREYIENGGKKENLTVLDSGEVMDSLTGEIFNFKINEGEKEELFKNAPAIVVKGESTTKTNMKHLEIFLEKELAKYINYVVVANDESVELSDEEILKGIIKVTEAEANKEAKKINSFANAFKEKRIEVTKEIEKPAKDLKDKEKVILKKVEESRQHILSLAGAFKENRFNTIEALVKVELTRLYELHGIEEHYKNINPADFRKEANLAKVALTKKCVEELEGKVLKIKALQDNIKIRTLELNQTCVDRGLDIPLKIEDIKHLINIENPKDYENALHEEIDKRLELEKSIKEQQERREQLQKEDEERKEKKRIEEKENEINSVSEKKKRIVTVIATFELAVNEDVTNEDVEKSFREKILKGSKTIKSIEVK